ncbi:MAG: histidine phosphatase family protein [Firmicutes bacterium]|nr:histidine phosphatase family protein [Bacillota bacterium]
MTPLVLWLLRHGEVEGNREFRLLGQRGDPPLTRQGRAEAWRAARKLAARPLRAVLSSDLRRARETAEAVARPHQLRPIFLPELRELDFGLWDGLTAEEARRGWPELWAAWSADPFAVAPPGGERAGDLEGRLARFLEGLPGLLGGLPGPAPGAPGEAGAEVAVVTHGGPLRFLWRRLVGRELEEGWAPGEVRRLRCTL